METANSTPTTAGGRHPAQDKITRKLQIVQRAAADLKQMAQGSARRNFGARGGKSVEGIVHVAKEAAQQIGPLFETWESATTSNTPAAQFEKRQQEKLRGSFERALCELESVSLSALQREQNAAGPVCLLCFQNFIFKNNSFHSDDPFEFLIEQDLS